MANYENIINYKSNSELENGVLKNKLGLKNSDELEIAERMVTNYKLAKLYLQPTELEFTVDYYLSIHKTLFEDVYPFAGNIRSEVIEKRIPFCLPTLIYQNLKEILNKARILANKIENEEDFIEVLAYLYSELDIIHPFREGNGRTEREFLRQYVNYVNEKIDFGKYELDYSRISTNQKDGLLHAIIVADATCELESLKEYIRIMLVNKQLQLDEIPKQK